MSALTSKEKIARQNNMVKSLLDVVTSTDGHGEAKEERKKVLAKKVPFLSILEWVAACLK